MNRRAPSDASNRRCVPPPGTQPKDVSYDLFHPMEHRPRTYLTTCSTPWNTARGRILRPVSPPETKPKDVSHETSIPIGLLIFRSLGHFPTNLEDILRRCSSFFTGYLIKKHQMSPEKLRVCHLCHQECHPQHTDYQPLLQR